MPWSDSETYAGLRIRLALHHLTVTTMPLWWDVDRPPDLARLRDYLRMHPERAPRTAIALEKR